MDESGNKESDRFFVCGFLEISDNQSFCKSLQRVRDQIFSLSLKNRQKRVKHWFQNQDLQPLYHLAKNFSEFELKHYLISRENCSLYQDFIKVLVRKTQFKFTAIVIDRKDPEYSRPKHKNELYLRCLKFYADKTAQTDYIFLPDSFDHNFTWDVNSLNLPKIILPLDSKACLQLQTVDILTGLVGQALKREYGDNLTNKDLIRNQVLKTLEAELEQCLNSNFEINKPRYFNICKIKLH